MRPRPKTSGERHGPCLAAIQHAKQIARSGEADSAREDLQDKGNGSAIDVFAMKKRELASISAGKAAAAQLSAESRGLSRSASERVTRELVKDAIRAQAVADAASAPVNLVSHGTLAGTNEP